MFHPGRIAAFVVLATSLAIAGAKAQSPFQVNLTVGNPPVPPQMLSITATNLSQVGQEFVAAISGVGFPGVTNTSSISVIASQSGKSLITISFPQNSTTANLMIPAFRINKDFPAPTRPQSLLELARFLSSQNLSDLAALALTPPQLTSFNPAVGNATSLTSVMMDRSFAAATGIGGFFEDIPPPGAETVRIPNALTVSGDYEHAWSGGVGIDAATIPLDYTMFFADPRYSLNLDMPLTYLRTTGLNTAQGSFAATFRFPVDVVPHWYLSAGARVGISTTPGLSQGVFAYSGTFASLYNFYFGDYTLALGNSVGVITTTALHTDGLTGGPAVTNYPLINGLSFEGSLPFTMFDRPASFEAYVVDTYFAGDGLYLQHWDEVGISIGTRRRPGEQVWNNFRVGLSYTFGRNFNMLGLVGSYRF
jgi:hypothetical protein